MEKIISAKNWLLIPQCPITISETVSWCQFAMYFESRNYEYIQPLKNPI